VSRNIYPNPPLLTEEPTWKVVAASLYALAKLFEASGHTVHGSSVAPKAIRPPTREAPTVTSATTEARSHFSKFTEALARFRKSWPCRVPPPLKDGLSQTPTVWRPRGQIVASPSSTSSSSPAERQIRSSCAADRWLRAPRRCSKPPAPVRKSRASGHQRFWDLLRADAMTRKFTPIMLPLGRLRLATRPKPVAGIL
jgi:hypothetical protein